MIYIFLSRKENATNEKNKITYMKTVYSVDQMAPMLGHIILIIDTVNLIHLNLFGKIKGFIGANNTTF